ncbi:MAG: hypothetical protein ACREDI_12710, partial [Roseiarcus sp.]
CHLERRQTKYSAAFAVGDGQRPREAPTEARRIAARHVKGWSCGLGRNDTQAGPGLLDARLSTYLQPNFAAAGKSAAGAR